MNNRSKILSAIAFLLVAVTGYWWYEHAARIDLQMEVLGVQGTVTVNGKALTADNKTFSANMAVIEATEQGIFNGRLEDGSYIQLTEDSHITISQAKRNRNKHKVRTKFVLDTGQVIRDIPKVETIGDYSSSLITTSVDIGIRGTRYAVIADDKTTRTMLYQGAVALTGQAGDELNLQQNFGTVIEKGKPIQPPSELPPPPSMLQILQDQRISTHGLKLGWQGVPVARAYLVEVADDSEFRNLVYRRQVSDTQLEVAGLPHDANFKWRVSSIDKRGLRGKGSIADSFHYKYHHEQIKVFEGDVDTATQLFAKALKGYTDDPILIKDIGKYYYRIGEYQQAISYYNKAIAIEPENDELLLERGRAYRATGQQQQAEKDFNQTLSIKTDSAEAYWSLGNVEADKDNMEDALEYYYRAIAADPAHARAHLSAAHAWKQLGITEKARRHMILHLENFPEDKDTLQQLEQLPQDTGNKPSGQ